MAQNGKIFLPAPRRMAAAALVMTAATTLAVQVQPASASSHRPCTIAKHSTTTGVTKIGTANPDKVSWQTSIKPVLASTVNEVSYETMKLDKTAGDNNIVNDAALPAYHIYVRTAAGAGVLIFEPYNYLATIGGGNPQRGVRSEWNVLTGPLWTSSTTIAGLPKTAGGPATLTFQQVVAANPRMTVTGIGFGLGTYNAGVEAILDEQRFATTRDCTEHQWSTGFKNGGWWPGRQR
jgi:hypothetical protein